MRYRTQKILLTENVDDEAYAYLLWCCAESNSLYNSVLFHVRQAHFEQCPRTQFFDKFDFFRSSFKRTKVQVSYAQLCKEFKENNHYQNIGGQQGQQTIKSVVEAITAYNKLLPMWFKSELKAPPKIPNYRKSGGLYQVAFTNQTIKYNHFEGFCQLPIARGNKEELLNPEIIIPGGNGFTSEQIAEVRIIPSNGKLWAEYVYKTEKTLATNLDYSQALGIDLGVNNIATAVSTLGKSFIIDGKKLKFINQKFNKFVANYKQGKNEFFWDEKLDEVTHKRNCQVRDYINKTARFLINHCLTNSIGNLVVGWNEGNKQEINIGKRNNQNFVQIPLARLKNRIKEIAESVGIVFTETEESYTSKSSFLDNDLLPKFGEKPKRYEFKGKRIKRGLYQTIKKCLINADCNGAANILKKVTTQLKINLTKVDKGVLTLPKRYFLTDLCREYRKKAYRATALA